METPQRLNVDDFLAERVERKRIVQEQWVKVAEMNIVREKLRECYKTEGVNHYEKCHHLTARYLELLKKAKISGYRKLNFD